MKPKVYIETSIVSYLTARPSRDIVAAAHQQITIEWWNNYRDRFDLFVSDPVRVEAGRGDPEAARRRLAEITAIATLELTEAARTLAKAFLNRGLLPVGAGDDALHVAISTTQEMDFLLTWNCRHIANAEVIPRLAALCKELGYSIPVLCTPEQLMGE